MNVKKEVHQRTLQALEKWKQDVDYLVYKNKSKFDALVREQTILKRQRADISELIRDFKGKAKGTER